MKVYLKKRHVKKICIIALVILVVLAGLKLVSRWDSKQGAVDVEAVTTVPPVSASQKEPDVPELPTQEVTVHDGQPAGTEYEGPVGEVVDAVYALQNNYVAELEAMYAEAETALAELAKEADSAEAMAALAASYLNKASELEQQCDAKIDAVVAELQVLVDGGQADPALIHTLVETYAAEKAMKKAWYMERLEEKGLIS